MKQIRKSILFAKMEKSCTKLVPTTQNLTLLSSNVVKNMIKNQFVFIQYLYLSDYFTFL